MRKGRKLSEEHKKILLDSLIGRKLSEESKKKISESLKGKKHTEERRRNISESLKGKKRSPRSEKHKKNLSIANKGKKHTEESKRKMSNFHTGKSLSEETRRKISKNSAKIWKGKSLSEETRRKLSEAHKGKKFSKETCQKMKKSHIGKALKGEKSHFWKGGITPLVQQIRACFKYRQWHSDNFTRDDYTCYFCGKRGGILHVDHYPKSFSSIFHDNKITSLEQALDCEEFWNINNGRTLCIDCHRTTDNYGSKAHRKRII